MAMVKFSEHPHNTPEQIKAYIAASLQLIEELNVPDDLREVAFAKAVDLCSAKQIIGEQIAPTMAIPQNMRH
jgi:hypothetical protein